MTIVSYGKILIGTLIVLKETVDDEGGTKRGAINPPNLSLIEDSGIRYILRVYSAKMGISIFGGTKG